jgi:predicted 2-oxoglutarate/Fe(II)-dependent dioxygenase YbiX
MNELASYTGGELVFHYTDGIDELNLDSLVAREEVKLGLGDVLIFPSIIYHEVKPIINGMRESLVTLILGPAFK